MMAGRHLSHSAPISDATSVNGMFFDRGAAVDYDAWAYLGNPGWGFDDLLPYFEKVCVLPILRPLLRRDLEVECGY